MKRNVWKALSCVIMLLALSVLIIFTVRPSTNNMINRAAAYFVVIAALNFGYAVVVPLIDRT